MKNKKSIIIPIVIVAALAICGGLLWYFTVGKGASKKGDEIFVNSVAELTGTGTSTVLNRFSGEVEPQKTVEVQKDSDKTVGEIYVQEGQDIVQGDKLFSYDTNELNTSLLQAQLELDKIANQITQANAQITELTNEKASAPADSQFEYTSQIQELQLSIKQSEYDKESKQIEIDGIQKSINNADVLSDTDGVIKSINQNGDVAQDGTEAAFITILTSGDYRIKGSISEQNVWQLSQGQAVIIRSRVDDNMWTGVISEVDTESQETDDSSSQMMYYDSSSSSAEMSTKYPFYIDLNSSEGLMMGQHVYIELNEGQQDTADGLWLYGGYIVFDEGTKTADEAVGTTAYVWASNSDNRLEKRAVILGQYNQELDEYEITEGLAPEDYIAWPDASLQEGMATTIYAQNTGSDISMGSDYSDYSSDYSDYPMDDSSVDTQSQEGFSTGGALENETEDTEVQ